MKNLILLAILGLITFVSCKKDNFEKFTPSSGGFEVKQVTASFSGLIVDGTLQGLEGVTVTIGSNTTVTDQNGVFFFKDISVPNNKAYFVAKKSGYFQGSRTIFAQAGSTHQVRIKMLDNSPIGSFQNSSGGIISLPQGAQLIFESGDVAYPNGDAYSGQVNVAAKRIDPTTKNGQFEMPGDLRGVDSAGKDVTLASYGMMAVELTDNNGNLLQVAPDRTVHLSFEVPTSLAANAPTEIPLWYFDETDGEWKEEGSAILSGNVYRGDVGHFSFWNLDATFRSVYFEATFVTEAGQPLVYSLVRLELSNGSYGYGYTDNTGWVGGLVPANATMKLFFGANQCQFTPQYIMDFTTTNLDMDLGIVTISFTPPTTYSLTGVLVNCDDQPVSDGYIQVVNSTWYTNYSTSVNSDGTFSIDFTTCSTSNSINLTGYDYENSYLSETMSYDITGDTDLGNIKACEALIDEFFTINFVTDFGNDTTITYSPPNFLNYYIQYDTLTQTFLNWGIKGKKYSPYSVATITCETEGVGSFSANGGIYMSTGGYSFTGLLNIISYPDVPGDYIVGTLTSDGSSPVVTGNFKIKK